MTLKADIAIVGAGMAGASLAAELAPHASVLVIEGEWEAGYHSTGRSAAFWSETYGGPLVQPLTSASGAFLANPPVDFADSGFLRPRGAIHLAGVEGRAALAALAAEFEGTDLLKPLGRRALEAAIPGLRADWDKGLAENSCSDIDVAALHAAYLKSAMRHGATFFSGAPMQGAERDGERWRIHTSSDAFEAAILVNAAGAWADEVAKKAGVAPLGIQPYRRTIVQLRIDPPVPRDLPLVIDAMGRFYFKPESGRLWLSPHDETACEPCDCAPEEYDVALAIDRLQQVVDWRVESVEHSWAGLRNFAPDRLPVYGFAPDAEGFFWCAGQGGFGIQTAPAAAKLAAALLLGRSPDPAVAGIDPVPYRADRFMS